MNQKSRILLRSNRLIMPVFLMLLLFIFLAAGCGNDDESLDQALEEARQQVADENASLINQSFTVTANTLYYPYSPPDERNAAEPGYQYVLVTVTVKNTGENPVVAASSDFTLEADNGQKYIAALVTDLDNDFGAARSPIPGSSETGSLAFAIPATAKPVRLWQEIGPATEEVPLPPPAS